MTYLDFLEQKVLLERLVIGLEEPVLIKGLGELSAKIDSGNGGYNVIHGTDFHQQGNELMFTTHDSFGHEKKMQATVIDTIEVNMGGGNIESRPVIELDIKFAGEDYKKIPFSVSDRSSNTNPILISKGFVENELEALIDVGAMNISHEGIDVVYGESWLKGGDDADLFSPIKSVAKGAVDGVKGVANGIKNTVAGTYNMGKTLAQDGAGVVKGLYGAGKNVVGDGAGVVKGLYGAGKSITKDAWGAGEKLAGVAGGLAAGAAGLVAATGISKLGIKMISGLAKKISFAPNLTQTDIKQIKSKIASVSDWVNVLQKLGATGGTLLEKEQSINPSKTKFIPVVSFSCQKGVIKSDKISWSGPIFGVQKLPSIFTKKIYVQGQEGRAQSWKKEIENARKGIEYLKTQNAQGQEETTEEQEEELLALAESYLLLTESDTEQNTNTEVSQEQSGEQQTQTEETADDSKQQEIITQFEDLGMFQLWFISISTDEDAFEYVTNTFIKQASFDKAFSKFYTGGKVSSDTAANIVREISQNLKKFNPQLKKKLSGMWCLALSPDANDVKKRQYHFFQQEPYLIYTKDSDINVDGNKIKEVFEKKFPTIKQAILGTEKALRKDVKGIAKGIIDGTAYQSEIQKQEDFPNFTQIVNKIKQFAAQKQKEGYNEDGLYKVVGDYITSITDDFLKNFIEEYTFYTLNQDDLGSEILQYIAPNKQFGAEVTSYEDLLNLITKQKKVEQLLSPSNEDEEWIEQKLNFLKYQGII